ncbi:MAG: transporter substrate-binding domain-containing protein [Granulosicoccus sp.]
MRFPLNLDRLSPARERHQGSSATATPFLLRRWRKCASLIAPVLSLVIYGLYSVAPGFAQSTHYEIGSSTATLDLPEGLLEIDDQLFIDDHETLTVGIVSGSHPPYQYYNNVDGFSGHAIEFLQIISDAIGFRLELVVFDDKPAMLKAMDTRQIDIIPSLEDISNRRNTMLFTSGIAPNPAALVGLVGNDTLSGKPDLTGVRVAVDPDSEAATNLALQFPDAIAVPVGSAEQSLKMLLGEETALYYGPLLTIFAAADQDSMEQLEVKQRVYFGTGWNHIAIRSDWPRVASLFERFIINGRSTMDEKLLGVVGDRLAQQLPPVAMSPFQSAYLSGFSSLKVGAIRGYGQINGVDQDGNHVGMASEFTAFVAYQLGLKLEIIGYDTAADMQMALESGEITLIPNFDNTFDRRRRLNFSDTYMTMPWLLVGNSSDTRYWDLTSLGNSTLALRTEHPLAPWIARNYPELNVLYVDSAEAAFDSVSRGEAEAVIELKLMTNQLLNTEYGGELRVLDELSEVTGQFGFAGTTIAKPLIPLINGALAQMDETLRTRMIRRWIAVDYKPEERLQKTLSLLVPLVIALVLLTLAVLYWNRRIAHENKKRKQAERLLVDMTERLRTGVFQIRQYKGRPLIVEFSNALTREMARMSPENVNKGDHGFFEYIDPEDREWVLEKLRACMSSRQHFRATFRFDFPNHEKGWILADAHCRVSADGANVWTGYLFDLTSERLLSEELNELLMSRDEFMSTSGHELKTPLQSLSLALEGIQLHKDPNQIEDLLRTARSAASDLIELVDDFVELSSMNQRALALNNDAFDFHELMNSLNRTFAQVAVKQSIEFNYFLDVEVPCDVWGDPMRIKQILYNLLGNAFKYTDEGSISFEINISQTDCEADLAVATDNEPVWVDIAIRDTGIGIEARHVPSIFQPFSTVGPSSRKNTGLGLAIVDRLTAVLGGSIKVDTEEGVGSEFVLRLPLNLERPDHALDRQPVINMDDTDWNLHSNTLLVVDDNLLMREMLASLLVMEGWNVLQADSADAALTILDSADCVALVTDQQMPGMTGLELARAVLDRSSLTGNRPVLIMMSGGMSREDAHQANHVFDAVLFKPIKTAQIRNAIETATLSDLSVL